MPIVSHSNDQQYVMPNAQRLKDCNNLVLIPAISNVGKSKRTKFMVMFIKEIKLH